MPGNNRTQLTVEILVADMDSMWKSIAESKSVEIGQQSMDTFEHTLFDTSGVDSIALWNNEV